MILYSMNNNKKENIMTKGTVYDKLPVMASKDRVNTMALTMVRNIAYKQIAKINKEIKENIEFDSELTKMIDINMKNAINKIIHDYKLNYELRQFDGEDVPTRTKKGKK